MKYCKNCLMPDTRPGSLFNKDGICQACINHNKRKKLDWQKRRKELKKICNQYKKDDEHYDCLIPVSGGKDSHFLVYIMKEKMGMNPLLITIDDFFSKTKAGMNNRNNLGKTFGCNHLIFKIKPDVFKKATRAAFENLCEPLRFIEKCIYVIPYKLAIRLGIPIVVFGENSAYEYGSTAENDYSAKSTIIAMLENVDVDFWFKHNLKKEDISLVKKPRGDNLEQLDPFPIYMSYFFPWSSVYNLSVAKKHGFQDLSGEWKREGCIEDFEQIDSMGYMVHLWLKYPKFGFQRTSDIVSRRIREDRITKEEGKKLILENDHKLDKKALFDFCNNLDYDIDEFWQIVEKFWNREIFIKRKNKWKMKPSIKKKLMER